MLGTDAGRNRDPGADVVRRLKRAVQSVVPARYHPLFRSPGARLRNLGWRHYCPVCSSFLGSFLAFPGRERCECPVCGSLERHRLLWKFLLSGTIGLFDGRPKVVLHIAPEWTLAAMMQHLPGVSYVSVDVAAPGVMVYGDLMAMPLRSGAVDTIVCTHVLEHVPDDREAMAELFRLLRPGGWLVPLVPIMGETTYEDASIVTPEGRTQAFGQSDHLRMYGADFKERLESVGFQVTVDSYARRLPEAERHRLGLLEEDLYVCRRPLG